MVMVLFLSKVSILSLVLTGYRFVFTMHALCAFSIARSLNARLCLVGF